MYNYCLVFERTNSRYTHTYTHTYTGRGTKAHIYGHQYIRMQACINAYEASGAEPVYVCSAVHDQSLMYK